MEGHTLMELMANLHRPQHMHTFKLDIIVMFKNAQNETVMLIEKNIPMYYTKAVQ